MEAARAAGKRTEGDATPIREAVRVLVQAKEQAKDGAKEQAAANKDIANDATTIFYQAANIPSGDALGRDRKQGFW